MIKNMLLVLSTLPIFLTSCATPPPAPVAFHKTDHNMLVIRSLDARTSQIVQPITSPKEADDKLLRLAMSLPRHQTAVVILENYTESGPGDQFRDRGTPWFIELRQLGYQHIYFLQGRNVTNPDGLITISQYD